MVDKAFLKFDRDGNGYIDINDLRGVYNASMHPKV
jgi:Ca2+-binding EF-hand superfamily protein